MLFTRRRGGGERLAFVHGFTQTERSWDSVADRLSDRYELVTIDAPGHGRSAHADADLPASADLVAAVGATATYVGYSMGGRICLRLALQRPACVQRMVLIGASPGIDDEAERAARRAADECLADRVEAIGIEQFVDEWLSLPLFAGLDANNAGRQDRIGNDPRSLALSLRHAGVGAQEPLWDRLDRVPCPVLLLAGELDEKFTAIAGQMAESIADATVVSIPGAGHSAHLERPDHVAAAILTWLDAHPLTAMPSAAAAP